MKQSRSAVAPGMQRSAGAGAVSAPTLQLDAARRRLPYRVARSCLLATVDALMLGLATTIAYVSWAAPMRDQAPGMYAELWPLVLLFIAGYARAGLYPGLGLGPVEMLRRLTYLTTFGFLVLAAFSFALKLPHLYSRVTFALAFVLSLILVPIGRQVLFHAARAWTWWSEPVAIIGTGRAAAHAIRGIKEARHLGYRPVAVLSPNGGRASVELEGVPIVGGLDEVPALAARGIRVAFLEIEPLQARAVLDRLQQAFLHVILLREFDDLQLESLQIRNLGNMVGIEYTNNLLRPRNQTAKLMLDLLLASVALLLLAPVIALAALAVWLVDGRPVFFHQPRAGVGGRRIQVPKIRTMRRDADRQLEEFLAANPELRHEWLSRYKLRKDPRLIPGVGLLLRRFSLDELPQLWTVLRGDMSLVGPRPFPDYHLETFAPSFRELRQRVRPGITGHWQISIRSEGSMEEQEALDTYYIRNWSVWFDLYVLARTIVAVASGRGAY
ncbi:MAG TPA: exopolysaccharide biosynthesis polyprenyl glycosylphosphotransferase [Vicinamibacterales bacterium]|nr:exopolysaccharide biosynthesis polyprenyl glycosylphosphotransferase [Vicinamibacterales bacterium]